MDKFLTFLYEQYFHARNKRRPYVSPKVESASPVASVREGIGAVIADDLIPTKLKIEQVGFALDRVANYIDNLGGGVMKSVEEEKIYEFIIAPRS